METWDVRIISASSSQDGDEPVVELFGKTRDRQSITILAYGYKPYLFAVDPRSDLDQMMNEDPEVITAEHDRLLYKSEMHDVLKVIIKSPWKVSEYKTKFQRMGYKVLSADISFQHRFFYDFDMGSCIRVTGERIDRQYYTDIIAKMRCSCWFDSC